MDNNTKRIKNKILSDNEFNISNFISNDFNSGINGIADALFLLMCKQNNEFNMSKIRKIILDLYELSNECDDVEKLSIIGKNVNNLLNKVRLYYGPRKVKGLNNSFNTLKKIFNNINEKRVLFVSNNSIDIKLLEGLIYKDKDIDKINLIIDNYPNILNEMDSYGKDVLYDLLIFYANLNSSNLSDINYYFSVILAFLNGTTSYIIDKNVYSYIRVLDKPIYRNTKHVKDILDILCGKASVCLEEFVKKYDISLDYSYLYNRDSYDDYGRVDFTYQDAITIDDRSSMCLDDALFMQKNSNGTYTLYVHISDVPSVVEYGSSVYLDAMKRSESLYLRDRKIELFPDEVTYDSCSLLANKYRNVISYVFTIDNNFDVIDFGITKGIIKVKHNLSYLNADSIISNPSNDPLDKMLVMLSQFCSKRKKNNYIKDKYRRSESNFKYSNFQDSIRSSYSVSSNIIQESMILVNSMVPKYFNDLNLPYPNRVLHLKNSCLESRYNDFLESIDISNISSSDNKALFNMTKPFFLTSKYSVTDHGHDGVGFDYYSHSTSPVRRSCDALGQYVIYDLLFNGRVNDKNIYDWESMLIGWCSYFNDRDNLNNVFCNSYNYLSSKKLIKK